MSQSKRKPKVGEKLYVKGSDWCKGYTGEREVVKVGRVYFYLKGYHDQDTLKIAIEGWASYSHSVMIYESEQHFIDKCKADNLARQFNNSFLRFGGSQHTLQQLQQVAKILGVEVDGEDTNN